MTVITMMASEPGGLLTTMVAARLGDCPGLAESMMESLRCSHDGTVSRPHPSLAVFSMPSAMANRRWLPKPKMLARRRQCRWCWNWSNHNYCGKNISGRFLVFYVWLTICSGHRVDMYLCSPACSMLWREVMKKIQQSGRCRCGE